MTYNLTISGKGFVPLMQTANNIVSGWLGIGLLIMYMAIILLVTKNYETKRGGLAASFVGLIISVLFWYIEIITDQMMIGFLAAFFLSVIWVTMQK